jgi:AraC-like DNA-binding protein
VAGGDLVLCPAGLSHAYASDGVNPWTICWVHFRNEGCAALLDRLGLSAASPVRCIGPAAGPESQLRDCCRILGGGYSFPLLLRASLALASFLATLLSREAAVPSADACRFGERSDLDAASIIRLMLGHLDQSLSLERLAALAGYSRYHFCRSFHRQTGYPPMEYFTRLKIQRACELLETTEQSGRAISEGLGFASPYYFSAVFKRITGMPPSEYRLRHRERSMV